MYLNSELDDEDFGYKVNRILRPFEYTRVDEIIELIFETQKKTEKTIVGQNEEMDSDEVASVYQITQPNQLSAKRELIADRFFENAGVDFERKSPTKFVSEDGKIGICCAVSKRYDKIAQAYWYALHPKWVQFMEKHEKGYLVLGCMDRDEAFCVPIDVVKNNIENLHVTERRDTKYWHIVLALDNGKLKWNISKVGKKTDLSPYALNL